MSERMEPYHAEHLVDKMPSIHTPLTPIIVGWLCPRCQRVNSPAREQCICGPKEPIICPYCGEPVNDMGQCACGYGLDRLPRDGVGPKETK